MIQVGPFQTGHMKDNHPLQRAFCIPKVPEKARRRDMPLFAANVDMKRAFDNVVRNEASKAMKEHRVGQLHRACISKNTLEMRLGHFTSRNFETTRGSRKAPWCSHFWCTQY